MPRPGARLRTLPIPLVSGTWGNRVYWIEIGGKEGGIQVALLRSNAALALMPTRESV